MALRTWHPDLFTAEALAQRLEDMDLIIDAMNARVALRIGFHHGRPRVGGTTPSGGRRSLPHNGAAYCWHTVATRPGPE